MQTETIAPILNSGVNGKNLGNEINPSANITPKSTFPIKIATIYPTVNPAKTDNCLRYPFALIFHNKQVTKVIVPNNKFSGDPKSAVYPPPKDLAPTVNNENPIENLATETVKNILLTLFLLFVGLIVYLMFL